MVVAQLPCIGGLDARRAGARKRRAERRAAPRAHGYAVASGDAHESHAADEHAGDTDVDGHAWYADADEHTGDDAADEDPAAQT